MNHTKKQRTLSKPEQEAADSVVSNNPAQLMNCENDALELISKLIKTHSSDDFRANRSLSTRWCLAYYRVAETDKVTTLCVMPDSTKPTSEELKSRFVRDIDIDSAVNIRHAPNIDAPNGPDLKDLEDHYPNVTQLFLSHKYFSQCWIENRIINEMTSLIRLDLNGYFFVDYLKLKPTLERLEQLSVNFYMRSFRVYFNSATEEPHFAQLGSCLTSKCTRFWFTQHEEKCSFAYWNKVNPRWTSALTHFRIDFFEDDNYYATYKEECRRWTISHDILNRFLDGQAPALKVLHLANSYIILRPRLVEQIAQMATLEDLSIGVYYDHEALDKAWNEDTLQSWANVRTLDITYKAVDVCDVPSDQFVRVLSTIVPNVQHLSICVIRSIYQESPVFDFILIRHIRESFTQMLSYKFSYDNDLIYEGKRNRPDEPFVNKIYNDDDYYYISSINSDSSDSEGDRAELDDSAMREKRRLRIEALKRRIRLKRELKKLTKNTIKVYRKKRLAPSSP